MARYGTRAEALRAWEAKKGFAPRHRHSGIAEAVRSGRGTETVRYSGCGCYVTREN